MKDTSTEFNTIAENPFGAKYIHKIIDLTNNTEIKDDIDDFLYSAMINDDDVFTIGNTCSATISFSIINPTVNLNNKEIEVYQGLNVNGTIEYAKLGIFKVLKPKKDRNITRFQCVDRMTYLMNMPYSSNLTFPTTDVKILEEICTQVDITLVQNGLISHSISKSPSGYTKREIIAYMSQLQGKNAIINSDGNLELLWYTDTDYVIDDNKIYYDGTSDINSEIDYKVEYIECTVRSLDGSEENVIKAGSGVNGIKIENPFMTQAILYEIANKLVGFTFRGAEFEFLGDFRLEVGDIVSVKTNNETYVVPIMQIEHKSDGGVVTTITSVGETDTENEIDLSSPNVHAMDRYYAELVLINKAMINKLSVDEADVRYLQAEQLDAIEANIETAVIENLSGKYVTVEELDVESARITVLEANSLTSESAIITELQTNITNTNTLIFGSATGGTIQTEFSNSVIAQLGDAQIKSAMIAEIDAGKITSGSIYTNKVNIFGDESGKLSIVDNTIVISDGTRTRVQIGKDASSDYNMYVWDKNGNLMFDALGLTEDGVTRKIIRDDIVKEDANISAKKLNIESLFNVINEDGSHTLKSSKIYVDADNQTLDVSFKNMTSNIATVTTSVDNANNVANSALASANTANTTANTASTNATSALDKATQANTKVDNLQVGGRNLATNTNKGTSGWFWSMQAGNYTASEVVENGVRTCKLTRGTTAQSGWSVIGYRNIGRNKWETNTTYTFSVEVKASVSTTISFDFKLTNAEATLIQSCTAINNKTIANEWRKLIWVVKSLSTLPSATEQIAYMSDHNSNVGVWYQFKNLKLEKGNKATDWSPAPEDVDSSISAVNDKVTTVTETVTTQGTTLSVLQGQISSKIWQQDITTAVDNLEIGGRNLYLGTKDFSEDKWANLSQYEDDGTYLGFSVKKREKKTWQGLCQLINVEVGEVYTLSAYIKKDAGKISFSINCGRVGTGYGTPSSIVFDTTTEWKKYTATFTATTAGTLRPGFENPDATQTMWICGLKLEKGNKATDWTPAPEDVDAAIETVNTSLTTKYSTLEQNLDGFKTEVAATYATQTTVTNLSSNLTTNYSTTTDMNSAIQQSADAITSSVSATLLSTVGYISKNLLKITAESTTIKGITFTIEDGVVTATGTATATTILNLGTYNFVQRKYTLSGCPEGGGSETYKLDAIKQGATYKADYGSGTTYNPTESETGEYQIRIVIYAGVVADNLVFKPMLRYAEITDATFEVYREDVATSVTAAQSSIEQLADSIILKTETTGKIASIVLSVNGEERDGGVIDMSGLVTFSDLSTSGSTTICGDNITTGIIKSTNYAEEYGQPTKGTKINLSNGSIYAANFTLTAAGNVVCNNMKATNGSFYGVVEMSSGKVGNWLVEDGYLTSSYKTGAPGLLEEFAIQPITSDISQPCIMSMYREIDSCGEVIPLSTKFFWYITGDGSAYFDYEVTTFQVNIRDADNVATVGKMWTDSTNLYISYLGSGGYIDVRTTSAVRVTNSSGSGFMPISASAFNVNSRVEFKQDISCLGVMETLKIIAGTDIYKYHLKTDIENGKIEQKYGAIIGANYNTDEAIMNYEKTGISTADMISITFRGLQIALDKIQELENQLAVANTLIQSLIQANSL